MSPLLFGAALAAPLQHQVDATLGMRAGAAYAVTVEPWSHVELGCRAHLSTDVYAGAPAWVTDGLDAKHNLHLTPMALAGLHSGHTAVSAALWFGAGMEVFTFREERQIPSLDEPVHFLQIWIQPERSGLEPGYQEASLSNEDKRGGLRLIGSGNPTNGQLKIHQDVDLYLGVLEPGGRDTLELRPERHAWVQVVRGDVSLNDRELGAGDGAAVSDESALEIVAKTESELLIFDLA